MSDVLVVVDMQEGFRFKNVEQIIPKVKLLLGKSWANVIFTKFVDEKDSSFEAMRGWTKFQKKKNQNLLNEFLTYSNDNIVIHNGLSITTAEFYKEINRGRAKTIYLCGIYTDVSIGKAAMDLFDKGINVKVISDAITSQNGIRNRYFVESLSRVIHVGVKPTPFTGGI